MVPIISLFLIVFLSRDIYGLWKRKDIIRDRADALKQLENRNADLQKQLIEAQSPAFIERTAREKLGLIKQGEEIVLVPSGQASGAAQPFSGANQPNWKQWWQLFF